MTALNRPLLLPPCAEQFHHIFDDMPVATTVVDLQYRYLYANRAMCELLGRDTSEIVGQPVAELLSPDDFARCVDQGRRCVAAGQRSFQIEMPYIHRDGHTVNIRAADVLIADESGKPSLIFMQLISVDWQREMDARLAQAHAQRDLLVREVHHRIKNNLQSVTGLLQRQMRKTPEAGDALKAAIAQVETIATVHGLHGTGDQRGVQLCDILASIVRQSNELYPDEVERCVLINALVAPAFIAVDETVALALVCNELVTNALKHGAGDAAIEIVLRRDNADTVTVVISNAIDLLPERLDLAAGRGLGTGLQLVRALLPPGAELHFHPQSQQLRVELILHPPLIQPTPNNMPPEAHDA